VAGHNLTMATKQTNAIDLENVQIDKLLRLLKKVEKADNARKAVWLPDGEREEVGQIRKEIETQTER
jgi:hypothetical protein